MDCLRPLHEKYLDHVHGQHDQTTWPHTVSHGGSNVFSGKKCKCRLSLELLEVLAQSGVPLISNDGKVVESWLWYSTYFTCWVFSALCGCFPVKDVHIVMLAQPYHSVAPVCFHSTSGCSVMWVKTICVGAPSRPVFHGDGFPCTSMYTWRWLKSIVFPCWPPRHLVAHFLGDDTECEVSP